MGIQETSPPNPLTPVEGNYPGCIAEAALEFGETEGDTGELTRTLERVAEDCPHNTGEGDVCLLAPVASHLGLVAIESQAKPPQWWLFHDASKVRYPKEILGWKVHDVARTGQTSGYQEVEIPVTVDEATPAVELIDGQMINALVYVQALGEPVNDISRKVLADLPKVVLASMSNGELAVEASLNVEEDRVTLADEIDGLIIHGNTRPTGFYAGPTVPQDKIILPWPRSRSQVIKLSPEKIHAFTNRV